VDLSREAANLWRFNYNFRHTRAVEFPEPLFPLVSADVLVESFEAGDHIARYLAEDGGLLRLAAAAGCCGWLLRLAAAAGCCGWLLRLAAAAGRARRARAAGAACAGSARAGAGRGATAVPGWAGWLLGWTA
jgi:hypothetical protein